MSPIIPAREKISARARSSVVPNQLPNSQIPVLLAINGMTKSSAIGPIKKAVSGDAVCSIL